MKSIFINAILKMLSSESYNRSSNDFKKSSRKKRYRLLIVVLGVCTIGLSSFVAIGVQTNVKSSKQVVQYFLEKLAKKEINRAELYYHPWSSIPYSPIFTEDQLINNYRDFKIVAYRGSLVHGEFVRELEKALRKFKFKRVRPKDLDYRLGCVFYANDEIMRIFISKNEPVVSINENAFEVSPDLVWSLTLLLPREAYDEIHRSIVCFWASSRRSTTLSEKQHPMDKAKDRYVEQTKTIPR